MKYIQDRDLEFLKNIESKKLNTLVGILTSTKSEELTKRDIYKEFEPNHKVYWEEIAAELQYFGGNTIINIARGKGVLYAEILRDVTSSIGIDIDKYALTKDIEDKLLKFEKNKNLLENIKNKFRNLNTENIAAETPLLLLTRMTPWSLPALLVKKLADPAYRVTIKAVYEIAKLRQEYNNDMRNTKKTNTSKNQLEYDKTFPLIRTDNNVEIGKINIIKADSCKEIDFYKNEDSTKITINKQLIADACKGIISTPNQTVELVFSPEVAEGLKNGTYKLLENRTIVVNTSTGKIKEHATVITSGQWKQLLTGGYQLLSIAVAQSHLADINHRLDSIEKQLEHIKNKLENEDKAKIKGTIEYLSDLIKNDNFLETLNKQEVKAEIESIKRDFKIYKNKLHDDYNTLKEQLKKIEDKDTFGTENTFNNLKKTIKDIEPLVARYELLMNLSLCMLLISHLINLQENSNTVNEFNNVIENFNKQIDIKSGLLKSYFNLDDTIRERKKIITLLQKNVNKNIDRIKCNYDTQVQKINSYKHSIIFSLDENGDIDKYAISDK